MEYENYSNRILWGVGKCPEEPMALPGEQERFSEPESMNSLEKVRRAIKGNGILKQHGMFRESALKG